jgi:crossover junction endodeoxyribonuclease RuvC
MIVLGVDPGSRCTGYGLVEIVGGAESVLSFGVCRPARDSDHPLRLKFIYEKLADIIEEYNPDECAVEMPVFGRDPQAMLKLGRAQAAAMLAALNRQIPVTEYTPKEVKKAVTGTGSASKQQVLYMVRSMLGIDPGDRALSHDAADALAVCLCHIHRGRRGTTSGSGDWARFIRDNPDRVEG